VPDDTRTACQNLAFPQAGADITDWSDQQLWKAYIHPAMPLHGCNRIDECCQRGSEHKHHDPHCRFPLRLTARNSTAACSDTPLWQY
jgi:hypothetical protein